MNLKFSRALIAGVILTFLLPTFAMASDEDKAEHLCKSKIQDVYGVSDFRHVSSEREGIHKFMVHGKVKVDDNKYDFNCKVKNGNVKSYAYKGPHYRHKDDADDHDKGSTLSVNKSVLEEECHETLQYRIRDEHDYTARVNLKEARIEGHDLIGDAKIKYEREHPQHATYTCHFDSRGRVKDSSYHLY
jgi:hypothetical protein